MKHFFQKIDSFPCESLQIQGSRFKVPNKRRRKYSKQTEHIYQLALGLNNSSNFVHPESAFSYSQQTVNAPYPEVHETNKQTNKPFCSISISILTYHSRKGLPSRHFLSGTQTTTFRAVLFLAIRARYPARHLSFIILTPDDVY